MAVVLWRELQIDTTIMTAGFLPGAADLSILKPDVREECDVGPAWVGDWTSTG